MQRYRYGGTTTSEQERKEGRKDLGDDELRCNVPGFRYDGPFQFELELWRVRRRAFADGGDHFFPDLE